MSKAQQDQWDHGGVKDYLETKAGEEQKDHQAQRDLKETVLVQMLMYMLCLCVVSETEKRHKEK